MRPALLPSLLLVAAALTPAVAHPQSAADTACSYTRCALRLDHGFFSTRLMRGASGEEVGRLGWFGDGVDVLLAGSDSAAHHAREYRGRRMTSDLLGVVGIALAVVGLARDHDYLEGAPFLFVGLAVDLAALPFRIGARRSLDRSVWWYNHDLPRP